jgi:hypothetical protein
MKPTKQQMVDAENMAKRDQCWLETIMSMRKQQEAARDLYAKTSPIKPGDKVTYDGYNYYVHRVTTSFLTPPPYWLYSLTSPNRDGERVERIGEVQARFEHLEMGWLDG